MLSLKKSLFFPQILRVSDVYLVKHLYPKAQDPELQEPVVYDFEMDGDPESKSELIKRKKVTAYRLHWDGFDAKLKEKHEAWAKQYHPEQPIPWVPALPPEYEQKIREAKFIISHEYMREIKRMSQAALMEWNISRGFDTNIREQCLRPAIEFVKCAFMLLADSLYDEETQYYSRGIKGWVMKYIMAWKFWMYQTGRGCVYDHAGMDELKRRANFHNDVEAVENKEFADEAFKWIKASEEHYKVIDDGFKEVNTLRFCDDGACEEYNPKYYVKPKNVTIMLEE